MQRSSAFSYRCNACGLCCRDKVIALSPYDVMRLADTTGLSTKTVIERYTIRRGSLLRFTSEGACAALTSGRCTVHERRPLPCRLYPLGIEVRPDSEQFVTLDSAPGSKGVYGTDGTVGGFLRAQDVDSYLIAIEQYEPLIVQIAERIYAAVDFDKTEPAEFRRVAVREALAESGCDPNPIIDAMFDSDRLTGGVPRSVSAHVNGLAELIGGEPHPAQLAAAGVLLAVSIGHSPSELWSPRWQDLR